MAVFAANTSSLNGSDWGQTIAAKINLALWRGVRKNKRKKSAFWADVKLCYRFAWTTTSMQKFINSSWSWSAPLESAVIPAKSSTGKKKNRIRWRYGGFCKSFDPLKPCFQKKWKVSIGRRTMSIEKKYIFLYVCLKVKFAPIGYKSGGLFKHAHHAWRQASEQLDEMPTYWGTRLLYRHSTWP